MYNVVNVRLYFKRKKKTKFLKISILFMVGLV